MAEIQALSHKEFSNIASKLPFNEALLTKDYYLTIILYLIRDIGGIYFKGGTALQKILLNYSRLSEDIDLSLTRDIKEVIKEITKLLEESNFFEKIAKDKDVEGFTRLIVHYKGFSNEEGVVFIDLNQRAKLLINPENHEIRHFYKENIPSFSMQTLAKEEMIAEKIAASIGRNQPRDHYDIYKIIKSKIPINIEMVKRKCRDSNVEFSIIKMFNQAQKLKNRWNEDLVPLLSEEVSFKEVITALARHFRLKEEKDKKKNNQ